jgi:DNA helicase II / ATP-dependent DNA helicase PcrA
MAWNDDLVGAALNIAATNNTPLRVMAGPGTGKSFAMNRRVARLLEAGANARRILAVTFTRTAAAGLVDDLLNLNVPNCEDVRAGTLHAFCFSLLNSQAVFEYLGRTPRPVITFTSYGVLRFEGHALIMDLGIQGAFGPARECTKRIRAFEAAWARLQSDDPGWPQNAVDRQFQTALLSWLRFHEAILIGELVPEALRFLRNNPNSQMRAAFDHVIVDEYQDLNRAEQDLLQLLAGAGAIAIVGDVDQSIYSFRHANPEGISNYGLRYPATHDEVLNECRRCPTSVVTIAAHLIANNHPAGPDRLMPLAANSPGQVHIVQWDSVDAEAQGIADYIRALINSNCGITAKDILVLTPRRLLGYRIRDRVRAHGIDVHSFYHEEALEGESAQRAFALLSLLTNIDDRVSLRWWLGHGSSSARKNAYQRLRQHCEQAGTSPREALDLLASGNLRLPNVSELVTKYRELTTLLAHLATLDLQGVVDALLPPNDEGCGVLRESAVLALPNLQDVASLFEHVKTYTTQPEVPEHVDYVRVMSLHKSKGLTSKAVIVTGCSHGLIPFFNADETPDAQAATLREQRRLFYVAITRCTEILVISSVSSMERKFAHKLGASLAFGRGSSGRTVASQFLDELGPGAPVAVPGQDWVASGFGLRDG